MSHVNSSLYGAVVKKVLEDHRDLLQRHFTTLQRKKKHGPDANIYTLISNGMEKHFDAYCTAFRVHSHIPI